jgi:hypothetical protein
MSLVLCSFHRVNVWSVKVTAEYQCVIKKPSKTKNLFMSATAYNIPSTFGVRSLDDSTDS